MFRKVLHQREKSFMYESITENWRKGLETNNKIKHT